jgi:hypothetical protein
MSDQQKPKNSRLLEMLPRNRSTDSKELSAFSSITRDVATEKLPKKPKRRRTSNEQSLVGVSI